MNVEKIIERIEKEILFRSTRARTKSGIREILQSNEHSKSHLIVDFLGIARRHNRSAIRQIITDESKEKV